MSLFTRLFQLRVRTLVALGFSVALLSTALAQTDAIDPGPRSGPPGAGGAIAGLSGPESASFDAGLEEFNEAQSVTGSVEETEPGLGPRFNLNSCAGCHAHPAVGGTSPADNPQTSDTVAPVAQIEALIGLGIISPTGPVREVRFTTDGGVHDLFTIAGLEGTPAGCNISPPDFAGHARQLRFRIPTPLFGLGLIEAIEDATILAHEGGVKAFGIQGLANRNGNDGTVTRFGWKAQNKSLVIFSGEAYNVEQGITNGLFPDERGEGGTPDSAACRNAVPSPQDSALDELDNVNAFANFMRFLAAPKPVASYGSVTADQIGLGRNAFTKAGCAVCHTPSMTTGSHASQALRNRAVDLFSDLLLHDIGTGDDIIQGIASGTEFRTAPLWGAGQRLFFLHDGSATNLVDAINAHDREASEVIRNYRGLGAPANRLNATERQNLLNFLRSL